MPSGYFASDYCAYPVASLEASQLHRPATKYRPVWKGLCRHVCRANMDALVDHPITSVVSAWATWRRKHTRINHPARGKRALEGLRKAMLVADLAYLNTYCHLCADHSAICSATLDSRATYNLQCHQARHAAPSAYSAAFSSAYMWAANAATVAPACDCADQRTHITLANLSSSWHRLFEHADRYHQFEHMFADSALPVSLHKALHRSCHCAMKARRIICGYAMRP